MPKKSSDEHERAAAGLDYDENGGAREKAEAFGTKMAEEGPEALFGEIENLLPESWREQIQAYPLAAIALGLGVGIWLGMKKSDEVIAAGSSLVSAAAMSNVSQVMDRFKQG